MMAGLNKGRWLGVSGVACLGRLNGNFGENDEGSTENRAILLAGK